jgi:hypothetical protein
MSKQLIGLLVLALALALLPSETAVAKSFPRDGRLKQLPFHKDQWYHIDDRNWYIKAPDKWVHFMGSYALTEITHGVVKNRLWTGVITLGLGLVKEYDDAWREGWSKRDIYMDLGGVASSLFMPEKIRLLAYYDDTSVMFKVSLIVD